MVPPIIVGVAGSISYLEKLCVPRGLASLVGEEKCNQIVPVVAVKNDLTS